MSNTKLETTHMLVVDPRPDDYLQLAARLRVSEYYLHFANSADEALRLPNQPSLDLWLINFRLPDMTGPELLNLVRSRTPEAACVLVSDTYSSSEELSARQLGATLYACKPLLADWLRALPFVGRRREHNHLAHGPPRASPHSGASRDVAHNSSHHTQS